MKALLASKKRHMSNPRRSLGGEAVLCLAASKGLNVNILCIFALTFDLFEAAFLLLLSPRLCLGLLTSGPFRAFEDVLFVCLAWKMLYHKYLLKQSTEERRIKI